MDQELKDIFHQGGELFHPGFSIDWVIFGYRPNQLTVLLLKMSNMDQWTLPGGFLMKKEDVDVAANRLLKMRTGLENLPLRQFYLFGDVARFDPQFNRKRLQNDGIQVAPDHWFLQRFITLGYYALADSSKLTPQPDPMTEACQWWLLDEVPQLILDHNRIIDKALATLRLQLNYLPIGFDVLPEKFTMTELQQLYETILGKPLDSKTFQKKMLSLNILEKQSEGIMSLAQKTPRLYSIDFQKYQDALQYGFQSGW